MQPVVRIAVQVRDGEDADVIDAIFEQDAVGKRSGEVTTDLALQRPIQARTGAHLRNQALDFIVKRPPNSGLMPA